nr:phytochrome B [Tanacetum cinerariifolium]
RRQPARGGIGMRDVRLVRPLAGMQRSAAMTSEHDLQTLLQRCADEPIRIPGAIQPHGVLLTVDEASWTEEGHGQVIAESATPELDAYQGLFFPASDIPEQARELYRLNWLRIIPDAAYIPVPMVPALRP